MGRGESSTHASSKQVVAAAAGVENGGIGARALALTLASTVYTALFSAQRMTTTSCQTIPKNRVTLCCTRTREAEVGEGGRFVLNVYATLHVIPECTHDAYFCFYSYISRCAARVWISSSNRAHPPRPPLPLGQPPDPPASERALPFFLPPLCFHS